MSFTRANPGGWGVGAKVLSTQLNNLDTDHANAVDKTGDTITGNVHVGNGAQLTLDNGAAIIGGASAVVILNTATATTLRTDLAIPASGGGPFTISASASGPVFHKYVSWAGIANTQTQLNETFPAVLHTAANVSTQILSVTIPSNTAAVGNLKISGKDLTNFNNVATISIDLLIRNVAGTAAVAQTTVSSMSAGVSPLTTWTLTPSGANILISVTPSSANQIDWQAVLFLSVN